MDSLLSIPTLLLILGILVAAFLVILARHLLNQRQLKNVLIPNARNSVFLEVLVPKEGDQNDAQNQSEEARKQIISIAEQMFTSISETYRTQKTSFGSAGSISFEIVSIEKKISFYIICPGSLQDLIEKQVHAQYPHAQVDRVKAYNPFSIGIFQSSAELDLQKKYVYPFRSYKNMESDPLNAITTAMSKLDEHQSAIIQMVVSSAGNSWQSKPRKMALEIQQGKTPESVEKSSWSRAMHDILASSKHNKFKDPSKKDLSGNNEPIHLTPMQQEIVKRLEEKASRPGFKANIRVITSAESKVSAETNLSNILSSFTQYAMPPFNGFKVKVKDNKRTLIDFMLRAFTDGRNAPIFNTEELASIWHLPTRFILTPNIKWLTAKKSAPPLNLPEQGLIIGNSDYRNAQATVRIDRDDRRRHMYLIGRTGTGKSELIKNMAMQDIKNGEGICVVDPHGDLIEGILEHIPKERAEDVILFEPFDTDRPMGLNILEVHSEEQKDFAVQEMISIFYKLVTDPAMLGPMFEHNMRNAMLTLMADEEFPGTIADIPRIFTDTEFQKYKVSKVKDPVVRNYWEKEMAKTSDFHKSEMLGYLISKVGRFVENSMMRNIVGQGRSSFDIRDVMDNKKILLLNLAKGKTGEINAKLIGLIIVSKIQMAALSRADMPEADRSDFYLYVDEFQNFITDAFSTILSEARKYRLNLIIAHQYLGQLEQAAGAQGAGTSSLRDAVFGNTGTELCFRIGVEDAEIMKKEFSPVFNEFDLVNIERGNAFMKLMIKGTTSVPFNIQVLKPLTGGSKETAEAIRQLSRLKFGRPRDQVEAALAESNAAASKPVEQPEFAVAA